MPDESISPASIVKGAKLEGIVKRFIEYMTQLMSSKGYTSTFVDDTKKTGKGNSSVDFLFGCADANLLYCYYIEAKNIHGQLTAEQVYEKILKKFARSRKWESVEPNTRIVGLVVGHVKMKKQDLRNLESIGIHYLNCGELKHGVLGLAFKEYEGLFAVNYYNIWLLQLQNYLMV